MEHLHIIVIFFVLLAVFFFIFGHIRRRNHDAGGAIVHTSLGILMFIIAFVLFLIMVNVNHMYENKEDMPSLISILGSNHT